MYVIILTFLSLYPKIEPPVKNISFFDKYEHFIAYAILMILSLWTYANTGKTFFHTLYTFIFSGLYGMIMEILQQYTGRSMEFLDFIADVAGLVLGYFIYKILFKAREKT